MTIRLVSLFLLFTFPTILSAQPVEASTIPVGSLENYVVQAGDVLRVQVFQEPELDREISISQDYSFFLPLIGALNARGKTVRQLEREISQRYDADFLVNPQVNVIVLRYTERRVNVIGMVNAPGIVTFPPEQPMTLIEAISRAGGINRLGDPRRVRLSRNTPSGEQRSWVININDLLDGTSQDTWTLLKDDIIFVPERRI